ncbi:MAG: sigma-70 family RNA polymerase sigma factor [Bacteroidota bacterium]
MHRDDLNIIKACKKGDRKAQELLYRKYNAMLFGICLRYAKDRQEAQDFLQESLIVLFRDLHQYQPKAAFGAWLRRVTVNICLQQLRKKQNVFQTHTIEEVCSNSIQKEADIFSRFREKALLQMVQQLPTGYRVVFNLYVIEGYSHQEIADSLDISVNTSKSQLSRAKASLRKLLEKELVDY